MLGCRIRSGTQARQELILYAISALLSQQNTRRVGALISKVNRIVGLQPETWQSQHQPTS